jgi:hypothetical protein
LMATDLHSFIAATAQIRPFAARRHVIAGPLGPKNWRDSAQNS